MDRLEDNTNLVPTYESRNSIHPLLSFSSDDYFGFLDLDEEQWTENTQGDHLLDIGIGKIPVISQEQAKVAIDKIVRYETSPDAFGDWRNKLLFIADDSDRNIHQRDADILASLVDTTYTQFKIEKLCLDQFEQLQSPTGESSIEARGAMSLLATARPVLSSTNFRLNQALHGAILAQSNSQYNRLGDIVRYTKNNSLQVS